MIIPIDRDSGGSKILRRRALCYTYAPDERGQYNGAAGEGVAVDPEGNVYGAEGPNSRATAEGGLTKYLKR